MSMYGRFYFRPTQGEQIHTQLSPAREKGGTIIGVVKSHDGKPMENALTLLFRVPEGGDIELLAQFATDEEGQFFFGPLPGDELYLIKVFKSELQVRELEIASD